jgi:FixJ family two-component response regulator
MAASLTHPTKLDKLSTADPERILAQLVQGVPNEIIARQVGVTVRQIQRYKLKHLRPALAVASHIARKCCKFRAGIW